MQGQAVAGPCAGLLERLEKFDDVTRMSSRRGQVLAYRGHLPRGLFLLVSGSVRLGHGLDDGPRSVPTDAPALLMPTLGELDEPSAFDVTVASDSELLFIPRTLALGSIDLQSVLDDPLLVRCPWH